MAKKPHDETYAARYRRGRKAKAEAEGFCSACFIRKPPPGFKTCDPCRDYVAKRQKKARGRTPPRRPWDEKESRDELADEFGDELEGIDDD